MSSAPRPRSRGATPSSAVPPFAGFPEEALDFYEGLAADPSKAYWTDHRGLYDHAVAAPMRALLAALGPEFGEAKFFRPYRDVRFSKDKNPYKGEASAAADGGLYLALSAEGLFLAGGYWMTSTDQARRLREAIAHDLHGPVLVRTLRTLQKAGFEVGGDQLKRIPAPWDDTHPRAHLLRHKSLVGTRREAPAPWLHTPEAADRIAAAWRALLPLGRWLDQHVGPTRRPDGR